MERRVEHVELIDYLVARLVCRFMDHGETLEDSAAFAEFWCHRIAEELRGDSEVCIRDGAFAVGELLRVSSAQAKRAYLLYRPQ